ncbi:uncharacterized protein MCYG_07826 [Microsporum canis CBS 113480]|uniref:Uncharacterized protein n=1 Tax=Arthroderma otae (strain ATCC MYA-4605 / CBS 113480) TaxID=554155 RepID=C5FXG7_ARTOC|nr:uncharacterized protein MCYG_07826 [Microsporum canis CBS 113480]EEQ35007.1 predicted protein [Microsporum canis CBS 113480]
MAGSISGSSQARTHAVEHLLAGHKFVQGDLILFLIARVILETIKQDIIGLRQGIGKNIDSPSIYKLSLGFRGIRKSGGLYTEALQPPPCEYRVGGQVSLTEGA